jgi:8-oxo-dGTP pyrophosphatase MutT (NUDIX family)
VRDGGRPEWAAHLGTEPVIGLDDVVSRLSTLTLDRSLGLAPPDLRRSAVAALLSPMPETPGLEVLLTRRAWDLRTHRGEVSFPGGAEDPGDDFPVGTALREANEEVGFVAEDVNVVGALDPLTTFTSDRVVIPVVVTTPVRPTVVRSPTEVDAILHVPLASLLDAGCYHREIWSWEGSPERTMHFFELVGDTIWGATASMLNQLLTALLPGRPAAPLA